MNNTFELVRAGINTPNPEEAEKLAQPLSLTFHLTPRHGQKSEFAGSYFECMKAPFLGANGHVAMATPDLESAVEELKEKGFSFNMDTAASDEAGKDNMQFTSQVRLQKSTAGGRIHLTYAAFTRKAIKYVRFTEADVLGTKRETVGLYNPTAAQSR